jgi:hypothetical protein
MACKGYLSASEAWRAGRRFLEAADEGRHCVVIHLGDHDPSGIDMTRDNAARLEMFAEQPIEVRRIALNMPQVERYRPPPNPAKLTDTRAGEYVARYGRTSWELDALNPRVLDSLIEDEVRGFIDEDVWQQTTTEENEVRDMLRKLHANYDDVEAFLKQLKG